MTALVLAVPGILATGLFALMLPFLAGRPLSERVVAFLAQVAAAGSALAVALLAAFRAAGAEAVVPMGVWYEAGSYHVPVVAAVDALAVGASATIAVVGLVVVRASVPWVHREPGHLRFFSLLLLALASMQVVALAGTLDLLFFGWELVGLCSFLLIGFFHERAAPVARATRALFTWRACDLGLLVAAVVLHHEGRSTALGPEAEPLAGALAGIVGSFLLLTAVGKSALVPVTGWLARALEGPTPSSALFYGALSVHGGVYLLLRAWPLYEASPVARGAMVAIGLTTALASSAAARVRTDAKGVVALGGSAQIGLVVVEIALGFHALAAVHALGNVGLRAWQLLRAPSAIHLAHLRAGVIGRDPPARRPIPGAAYGMAARLFRQDDFVEGWLVSPLMRAARAVDRVERWAQAWAVNGRDGAGGAR